MANISELRNDAGNLVQVLRKIEQVARIRLQLYQNYKQAHAALERNPADKKARRVMAINLQREKKVLDIVRNSTNSVNSILSEAESAIKNAEIGKDLVRLAEKMMGQIREVMKFSSKRIRKVERRLAMEEQLEERNYNPSTVKQFIAKFDNERKKIDQQVVSFLKGEVGVLNKTFMDYLTKARVRRIKWAVGGAVVTPMLIFNKYFVMKGELIDEGYAEEVAAKMADTMMNQWISSNEAIIAAIVLAAFGVILGILGSMYADAQEARIKTTY